MKWITDYQYVRGINLMVIGCYSLSTKDHLMCGERPHFGPINPLWDYIPTFHSYVARLGYALSCGQPAIETALYFPVRDMFAPLTDDFVLRFTEFTLERSPELAKEQFTDGFALRWARGVREKAVDGYETLVDALFQNQCGFDLIDDDALTDTEARIEKGVCRVGPMTYRKILFPPSLGDSHSRKSRSRST